MFKFNLLPNEKVIKFFRQAESVLFKPVLIIFFLIYSPWYFLIKYDLVSNYKRLLVFWTVLVFLYGVNKYILWLVNVSILTNQRIIKVHYMSMFNKKVLEAPLERVLNVSFSRNGLFQTVLGVGSVQIQVAGLPEPMVLHHLASPERAKDLLWANLHSHPKTQEGIKYPPHTDGLTIKTFSKQKRTDL